MILHKKRIILTKHVIERFKERVLTKKELKEWDESTILSKLKNDIGDFSVENNSWKNNSRFSNYLFEKYGAKDFRIFESDRAVYISIYDTNIWRFITCLDKSNSSKLHYLHQSKSGKLKKIEQKRELKNAN